MLEVFKALGKALLVMLTSASDDGEGSHVPQAGVGSGGPHPGEAEREYIKYEVEAIRKEWMQKEMVTRSDFMSGYNMTLEKVFRLWSKSGSAAMRAELQREIDRLTLGTIDCIIMIDKGFGGGITKEKKLACVIAVRLFLQTVSANTTATLEELLSSGDGTLMSGLMPILPTGLAEVAKELISIFGELNGILSAKRQSAVQASQCAENSQQGDPAHVTETTEPPQEAQSKDRKEVPMSERHESRRKGREQILELGIRPERQDSAEVVKSQTRVNNDKSIMQQQKTAMRSGSGTLGKGANIALSKQMRSSSDRVGVRDTELETAKTPPRAGDTSSKPKKNVHKNQARRKIAHQNLHTSTDMSIVGMQERQQAADRMESLLLDEEVTRQRVQLSKAQKRNKRRRASLKKSNMDLAEEKTKETDLETISGHSKGAEDKTNVEGQAAASQETSHLSHLSGCERSDPLSSCFQDVALEKACCHKMVRISPNLECYEDFYSCPITQEIMCDPVLAKDGHTYERGAIEQWFEKHCTSPMTNEELDSKVVQPNLLLKQMIQKMHEQEAESSR